jgi:hypothetical protein
VNLLIINLGSWSSITRWALYHFNIKKKLHSTFNIQQLNEKKNKKKNKKIQKRLNFNKSKETGSASSCYIYVSLFRKELLLKQTYSNSIFKLNFLRFGFGILCCRRNYVALRIYNRKRRRPTYIFQSEHNPTT